MQENSYRKGYGVHTEVKLYDGEIFVNISGLKSKVLHIDYDSLY